MAKSKMAEATEPGPIRLLPELLVYVRRTLRCGRFCLVAVFVCFGEVFRIMIWRVGSCF